MNHTAQRKDVTEMQRRTRFLGLVILTLILMIGGMACVKTPEKTETPLMETPTAAVTENIETPPPPKETATPQASSSAEATAKRWTDRQIVKAVFWEWWPSLKEDNVDTLVDEVMEMATELSGTLFGRIISEEDAIRKAQAAWIALGWASSYENADESRYRADFYNGFGVWMVDSFFQPRGSGADGIPYPVPGSGYCIIMRKSDGKVLAVWPG